MQAPDTNSSPVLRYAAAPTVRHPPKSPGHHSVTSRLPTRLAHNESMATPLTTAASTERAPSRLLNRELSWLEYEARLLELAEDPSLALLERVRICKFFSSN